MCIVSGYLQSQRMFYLVCNHICFLSTYARQPVHPLLKAYFKIKVEGTGGHRVRNMCNLFPNSRNLWLSI